MRRTASAVWRAVPRLAALLAVGLATGLALPGCPTAPEDRVLVRPAAPASAAADGASTAPAATQAAPFTFMYAGDPQMGAFGAVAGPQARFIRLAGIANERQPAFVIVGGNLVTHASHAKEQDAADAGLAAFRVPLHLIAGNHDDLPTFRRKYGRDWYAFTYNNCAFVCINSTLMGRLAPSAAEQAEIEQQWQWLEGAGRGPGRRADAYLSGHAPHALRPGPRAARLEGLVKAHGVEVLLCGHVHRTHEILGDGYVAYTTAGTGYTLDGRGLGYRLFTVYPDRIEQKYVRLDK